jgi:hypothetical protein
VDGITEVAQHVPAVRDLDGLGRTLAERHRHRRWPGRGRSPQCPGWPAAMRRVSRRSVRQEVEHPVPLEIDEHRP